MTLDVERTSGSRGLRWIMSAVLLWGCLLAIGATLFGVDARTGAVTWSVRPMRGVVVLTCFTAFLLFWLAMLRQRITDRS